MTSPLPTTPPLHSKLAPTDSLTTTATTTTTTTTTATTTTSVAALLLAPAVRRGLNVGYNIACRAVRYRDVFFSLLTVAEDFLEEVLDDPSHLHQFTPRLTPLLYSRHTASMKQIFRELKFALPTLAGYFDLLIELEAFLKTHSLPHSRMLNKTLQSLAKPLFTAISDTCNWLHCSYQPGITQTDITRFWELCNIDHLRQVNTGTVVLWVDDSPNKRTLQECEDPAFVFSSSPAEMKTILKDLAFLAEDPVPGRFRVAVNSRNIEEVFIQLEATEFRCGVNVDVLVNSEVVTAQQLMAEAVVRPHLMSSIDVVGLINFVKMSTVIWLGALAPSTARDIKFRGVVIHSCASQKDVYELLRDRPYLREGKYVRILVADPSLLESGGGDFVQTIRSRLHFKAPILLQVQTRKGFDESVYQYPFVHVTSEPEELVVCGSMGDIPWARSEMLGWAGEPVLASKATLTIHSLRCSNLSPMDVGGLSDPFVVLYLDNHRVEKTKIIKESLFPVWDDLDWTIPCASLSSLRLEVFDYDRVGGNDFEGLVRWQHVSELAPTQCHRWEATLALTSRTITEERTSIEVVHTDGNAKAAKIERKQLKKEQKRKDKGKNNITGSITIVYSFTVRVEDFVPKHFGRPLAESLAQSMEDEVVHPTHQIIYSLMGLEGALETEGIFRIAGNALNVKSMALQLDAGNEVKFEDHPILDVCSLLKSYYAALPDKLLPASLYADYKAIALAKMPEERRSRLRKLVTQQFPPHHSEAFIDLVLFLNHAATFSSKSKMTAKNLANCLAPTLIIPIDIAADPQRAMFDTSLVTEFLGFIVDSARELFPPSVHRGLRVGSSETPFLNEFIKGSGNTGKHRIKLESHKQGNSSLFSEWMDSKEGDPHSADDHPRKLRRERTSPSRSEKSDRGEKRTRTKRRHPRVRTTKSSSDIPVVEDDELQSEDFSEEVSEGEADEDVSPPRIVLGGGDTPKVKDKKRAEESSKLKAPSKYTVPEWATVSPQAWYIVTEKAGLIRSVEPLPRDSSYHVVGRDPTVCSLVLSHPSVSRQHAVLQFGSDDEIFLYDLGSSHGTSIEGEAVAAKEFISIKKGTLFVIGTSTRQHRLEQASFAESLVVGSKVPPPMLKKQRRRASDIIIGESPDPLEAQFAKVEAARIEKQKQQQQEEAARQHLAALHLAAERVTREVQQKVDEKRLAEEKAAQEAAEKERLMKEEQDAKEQARERLRNKLQEDARLAQEKKLEEERAREKVWQERKEAKEREQEKLALEARQGKEASEAHARLGVRVAPKTAATKTLEEASRAFEELLATVDKKDLAAFNEFAVAKLHIRTAFFRHFDSKKGDK